MKSINLIAAILFTSMIVLAGNEGSPLSPVATTTITGIVIDKVTGEALAGVKINIENTEKEVYTDLDGNFEFTEVKQGTHNIKTNLISYGSSIIEIECNMDAKNIKISLDNK